MKSSTFAFVLGAIAMLAISCAPTNNTGNKIISGKQFGRKMNRANAVVLDVRTPDEFNLGHLNNAIFMDYKSGGFDTTYLKLEKNKTYLIYCKSGRRSDMAATKMKAAGFEKVYQLKNGIDGWRGEIIIEHHL